MSTTSNHGGVTGKHDADRTEDIRVQVPTVAFLFLT